jgi:hypothetical protein
MRRKAATFAAIISRGAAADTGFIAHIVTDDVEIPLPLNLRVGRPDSTP